MSEPSDDLVAVAQFTDADIVASISSSGIDGITRGTNIIASVVLQRGGPPNQTTQSEIAYGISFATRGGERRGPFLLSAGAVKELRKIVTAPDFGEPLE
jgi:hypothetical protein